MTTLGVIEVACDLHGMGAKRASRLSAPLGGQSLLTWLIRRVTEAERLDRVVVVFSKSEAQRFGLPDLVPADVECFIFDSSDPLKRIVGALDQCATQAMVRVGMESPFVDPALIDGLICAAETGPPVDYVSYRLRDGKPAILSQVGMFAEWFSASALRRVDRRIDNPDDRQQLSRYFLAHLDEFQMRFLPAPEALDRVDARLSIDATEDWELAEDIFDALGEDGFTCYNLGELFSAHPAMRRRMQALNQAEKASTR